MSEPAANYRQYLDPHVLARVGSLELRARLIVEGLLTGQHRSPYQGASVEFAQHRPYVQGDDIRHVDWKLLARNDKVYLKQYQVETNLELMLCVDASESMGFGTVRSEEATERRSDGATEWRSDGATEQRSDGATKRRSDRATERRSDSSFGTQVGPGEVWTKYDHATAIAASLAYLAIRQQDSVGLAVFDQQLSRFFRASNSPAQWKLVINELQAVPRWNKTGTGRVLEQLAEKLTHRSLVVVISDLLDDVEDIIKGLKYLRYRKHEVIVLQVLDPAEIDFPFEDVTLFKGLEEAGELLTEPRALREGYLEQLRLFTESLSRACRGLDIDFQRLSSGDGLEVTLSQFLADRMGRGR
ncbi:MAG: DUF58 domain-containing protein [Tepidisphaerales bacterium]